MNKRHQMILDNLKLVYPIARSLRRSTLTSYEDLVSAGKLGLIKAVDNFKEQHDNFEAFAKTWIKAMITREIRANYTIPLPDHQNRKVVKLAQAINNFKKSSIEPTNELLAKDLNWTINEVKQNKHYIFSIVGIDNFVNEEDTYADILPSSSILTPDKEYKEIERQNVMKKILEILTLEETAILSKRFGLDLGIELEEGKYTTADLNKIRKSIMKKIRKNPQIMETLKNNRNLF